MEADYWVIESSNLLQDYIAQDEKTQAQGFSGFSGLSLSSASAHSFRLNPKEYERIELVDKSKYNQVWKVRKNEKVYILKTIAKQQFDTMQTQRQIVQEIENHLLLSSATSSPHIIQLHGFCETPTKIHLLMELGPAPLLKYVRPAVFYEKDDEEEEEEENEQKEEKKKEKEKEKGNEKAKEQEKEWRLLTVPEIKIFFKQLFFALQFCHSNHIIFNDIKLENILVDVDSRTLKLVDFGWSARKKPNKKNVHQKVPGGTYLYMAPEKFFTQTFDERADMWACGVLLFECFTGRTPFESNDENEIGEMLAQYVNDFAEMRQKFDFAYNEEEQDESQNENEDESKTNKENKKKQTSSSLQINANERDQAEALDLIRKLMHINPQERLTIELALTHPFFKTR